VNEAFKWGTLFASAKERAHFAESFLAKVGPKYWGSEEIRRKHLLVESGGNNTKQFQYPEMSE
jgi:hypothetical protein